ncbi:MAG: RNA polymerase factor sigma-32 [Bdellovibrionales bacterium]|nr:RNA polymerase factor sigma-32 [Bdellovibrionales bacterium]
MTEKPGGGRDEGPDAPDHQSPQKSVPAAPPSRGGAVVPYDPLSVYLREMRRYPRLSREEENALAVDFKEKKDVQAAYRLVSSNLWLVVKIAKSYEKSARNLLDLIQEGNIGLMEAVKNYDPYRGVRFPSYAVWWIKAYIVRYMIANLRMVKIGTTQAQRKLFFNLRKEKDKLERLGIYPKPKLLAERLNVKESEVLEMEQRLGAPDVSVDASVTTEEEEVNLLGILSTDDPSSEELVSRKEQMEFVHSGFKEFSSTLKAKEKVIFQKRLVSEDKATLQELSDELKISRERVRQIEARIKEKLRDFFEERMSASGESLEFE